MGELAPPKPLWAGLHMRCPRCGKGALFSALLTVTEHCNSCRLSLKQHDSGDGPAFIVITLMGGLVTALAAYVELSFSPPLWVHAVLWLPFVGIGSILLLRLSKSLLIAYQYSYRWTQEK